MDKETRKEFVELYEMVGRDFQQDRKNFVGLIEHLLAQEEATVAAFRILHTRIQDIERLAALRAALQDMPDGPERDDFAEEVHEAENSVDSQADAKVFDKLMARWETKHEQNGAFLESLKKSLL